MIQLEQVTKTYPKASRPSLDNVSVSIEKGDFVFLVFESEQKNPNDPSQTFRSNSFEVLRLENGKVQEHWDSAKRNKLPAGAPAQSFEQPKSHPERGNTGTLSAEEKRNLEIGTMELKDMLQYGHLELADKVMDPGYIQHNPNVPQGRDGAPEAAIVAARTPSGGRVLVRTEDAAPLLDGDPLGLPWEV